MIAILLSTLAFSHSGGTDSNGCHAGSKPYHCHGSTHIDFESVNIKGDLVKPSVQYVKEEVRLDPCKKYTGTDEYVECSINLSYEAITSLCDTTQYDPSQVKKYLDVLIEYSLMELIYESLGKDGWQYRYFPKKDYYVVVNSPQGKWNGKRLRKGTKGYKNVYEMHSNQLLNRIKSVPGADYQGKKVTTWQSCSSNGIDVFDKHWYTQVRGGKHGDIGEFAAWPLPVGKCKSGETIEAWGRGGMQTYCREFDGTPTAMSKTVFMKDINPDHDIMTHHIDPYVGLISMPDVWMDLDDQANSYVLPISSTMLVVVNNKTNEFGILYRNVQHQEGMNIAGGPMIFEPEHSYNIFKSAIDPQPTPVQKSEPAKKPVDKKVLSPENKWAGPLAIIGFVAGMLFIVSQNGGF